MIARLSLLSASWRYGLAQALVIAGLVWLALGGPDGHVRAPVRFDGSSLIALGNVRAAWDTGSWWTLPHLAAFDQYTDPLLANGYAHVDAVFLSAAHVISRGVPAVVSLAWGLMLIAGAASASWCLRRLGVSDEGAWAAGILFALSPFALSYNTESFGLMPSFVPFAAFAAIALASGGSEHRERSVTPGLASLSCEHSERPAKAGDWPVVMAGSAVLALNSIYYAWFGILVVSIGTIAGYVRTRSAAVLRAGAGVLAAIALAMTVNLMSTHAAYDAGSTSDPRIDRPADSELFSLKLRRLVSPLPDSWIAPLRSWAAMDARASFPAVVGRTELGMIGALGLVGLMVVLFVPRVAGAGESGEALRATSRLMLAALLVATTGGLGSLFTALAVPGFTKYMLLAPFIAFFAVASMAWFVDRAVAGRRWRIAAWVGVLVIGLFDHGAALDTVIDNREEVAREAQGIRDVVFDLEKLLPIGSTVAQLPVQPNPRRQTNMHAFDHLKPYALSRTLRWTFPATTPEQQAWLEDAARVTPAELVKRLRRDGISAIVIDRLAYPDEGAELLRVVQTSLSRTDPVRPHSRYVALDIRER